MSNTNAMLVANYEEENAKLRKENAVLLTVVEKLKKEVTRLRERNAALEVLNEDVPLLEEENDGL